MNKLLSSLGVLILLQAGQAAAQRDFSKVEVRTDKVADNLYMLTAPEAISR